MDFRITKEAFTEQQLEVLSKDVLDGILDNVAQSARNHWINIAKKDTSHLRTEYLHAIQPIDAGKSTWTISLLGEIPHILEDGAPALDMRSTLLGLNVPVVPVGERGKHKNAKGGFYRAIPFRHTTPTSGSLVGQAMGSAYSGKMGIADSKKLGRKIYNKAKQLASTKTDPYGKKTKWGKRLPAGYAPKLKKHHKTDIYAGMVKQTKTYEKATQSQYMTFRTISTSVSTGWIRKPIEARHYAEKVNKFVNRMIPRAIEAYIKGVDGR